MDRRSWPWKKKSSDKIVAEKTVDSADSVGASLGSVASLRDQENYKNVNYVQIPLDSYTHLTGLENEVNALEDQVKMWQNQVKDLQEKLSVANTEMSAKDNLVKQHAKVAEEAVSGWEKADAEAMALKHQLESVKLLKLTAEDRASNLDGALKECMRQIRMLKEEHEEKVHEVVLNKTKQSEKIKRELEAKITVLDQGLLKSAAENAALSKSLQEHASMLMKINDEKSQANVENELLKENILSYEKENSSFKYELHVLSKELDIRNEEKNMSLRSAEAANKQHLESVKKIAKLEAECQRLRGLVRKKLPGPAALAQMKQEVDNWGHDFGEPRLVPPRVPPRSLVKNSKSHLSSLPEFSTDNSSPHHKEKDFLAKRLLATEEETKMLKEALAKRNSELQSSRDTCAKIAGRINNLEAQLQIMNQRRGSPRSIFEVPTEGFSQNASNPQSVASLSDDWFDDDGSFSESWVTPPISDISHLKKDKGIDKGNHPVNSNSLELMDDFLEMERMAHSSNNLDKAHISSSSNYLKTETTNPSASVDASKEEELLQPKLQSGNSSADQVSSHVKGSSKGLEPDVDQLLSNLLSRMSMALESQMKNVDTRKELEYVKYAVLDIKNSLVWHSFSSFTKEAPHVDVSNCLQDCPQYIEGYSRNAISLTKCSKLGTDTQYVVIKKDMEDAVSHIHQFVFSLGSKMQVNDSPTIGHGFIKDYEDFSASVDKFLFDKTSLIDFVLDLSRILAQTSELKFIAVGCNSQEGEITSFDRQSSPIGCSNISHSCSNPDGLMERKLSPGFSLNASSCKCSLELELLKSERDSMEKELARYGQDFESTKLQLEEMGPLVEELRLELASSKKSNSLAETQLKCMTESYKSLEIRAQEFETNMNILQAKTEDLDNMLQEEKRSHQDVLVKCKGLEDQLHRKESSSTGPPTADLGRKSKQEREIAVAAAKLAECQQTIYLLGRQLKTLHPRTDTMESQYLEKLQMGESPVSDKPSRSFRNIQEIGRSHGQDLAEIDRASSLDMRGAFEESPIHNYDSSSSPSSEELNQRASKSSHSSASALALEKHQHGFSHFMPSKGKH